jgi:hypothetical protein
VQKTLGYKGIMLYDTLSSNVTFVDWRSDKTYHFSTTTNLHFTMILGPKSRTYTVIAGSGSGTDTNGFYHLDDYMISGENETLTIASNATFVFPKHFTGSNNRSIQPDANGKAWLEIWGETMTFWPEGTKLDNNNNLTSDQVVSAQVTWLQSKGYKEE